MVGPWHLSLLLLDSDRESFEEVDVCIKGQIEVYNQTSLKQQWRMLPTKPGDNPEAKFQVTTLLVRPAVWLINTPLGGQLKATVVAYKRDEFAVVVHCGWQHGDLVHMWTAAITRSPVLTPQLRLQLTSALINTGYQPSMTKVITWSKC
ncbi:hypothetical protein AAG570_010766 [Ranatra chinensis]|uniref:Uncharacterized protein n=1 Tax=Ranatra chinensis TaxID=642074 RepID=A0ABD0YQN4_9HEMI